MRPSAPRAAPTRDAAALDPATLDVAGARELARARRHGRHLTVLAITGPGQEPAGMGRFAAALAGAVRELDAVGVDEASNLVVVLAEADREQAERCVERLAGQVEGGGAIAFAAATFPDDALSWPDVRDLAVERARGIAPTRVAAPRTPRPRRRSLLRRAADLLVLVLAAPVVAPVVAVLALLIRLTSRGSPLITHRRVGRGGREFELHKLRTMYEDAEVRKHELAHLNVLPWPDFKIPNDPRVTPLGRWLRRTSLDELPQLWNLLRGEVTLVGPRPCSVPVERYELWQTERLHVTPGLFGRWQAEGRGSADFRERSRMDIRQLRGASLASDARLAVQSVVALLRGKGSS